MGATFQYILAQDGGDEYAARQINASSPLSRHDLDGWTAFVLYDVLRLSELDELAVRASGARGLALAAFVEDSAYAYVVGARKGELSFRMVLQDRSAKAYREGVWALRQCASLSGSPSWKADAARRVVSWAAEIRPVDVEAVLALADKDWVYATDAIEEFMDLVGVPNVGGDAIADVYRYRRGKMRR